MIKKSSYSCYSRLRAVSFSSDLVRAMHARGSGEAARRAKRARHHSRACHLRVSRFARRTTEKRETARSLLLQMHELQILQDRQVSISDFTKLYLSTILIKSSTVQNGDSIKTTQTTHFALTFSTLLYQNSFKTINNGILL